LKRIGKKDRLALSGISPTLSILQDDAFDPRLGTHKLKGDLAGFWACSAGYDLRIVFEIVDQKDQEIILLVSIGTHDEVY
jgi:addiction module RelE/StbE family toxin